MLSSPFLYAHVIECLRLKISHRHIRTSKCSDSCGASPTTVVPLLTLDQIDIRTCTVATLFLVCPRTFTQLYNTEPAY